MRLATWNINGMKARLGYIERWLAEVRPDVVGLQELKMVDEKFPHEAIEAAGYRALTHGQKSWNGVAVLLRKDADELAADEAEVTQIGLPGQDEMGARLLTVAVADLSFTTIYAPNGKTLDHPDFQRKLAWYDALIAHLARSHQADQQMIVCGDFNITPAALDSWSEPAQGDVIFHTEAERSRMRALLDWGLRDVYRAAHPDEPGFTWWDYRGGSFHKGQGLRIDLLLATAGVAERSRGVHLERTWRKKIDGMTPSDHAPVWVDIAPA